MLFKFDIEILHLMCSHLFILGKVTGYNSLHCFLIIMPAEVIRR